MAEYLWALREGEGSVIFIYLEERDVTKQKTKDLQERELESSGRIPCSKNHGSIEWG